MGKLQQPGGTLADFLRDLLRELENFKEGWLKLQRDVVNLLCDEDRVGHILRRVLSRFSDQKIAVLVQKVWHPRFRKHLDLEPPQEAVLCAFGEVQDIVVKQAGLSTFLTQVIQNPSFNLQTFQTALQNPKSLERVNNLDQVAAALAHSMQHPPALKSTVVDDTLRNMLQKEVNALVNQNLAKPCLGGAPATISDVLAQLGLQRVHLVSMYHSDGVASLYRGQPLRLDLNVDQPQPVYANQPGQYKVGGIAYPHPTRCSYIFPYKKGYSIFLGNQKFGAVQDDRVIFRVRRYIGDHSNQWQQVKIKFLQRGHLTSWVSGPKVDPKEWPAPRGFVRWRVNNNVLELEYLDEAGIRELCAGYDYIILNAPGLETFQRADPLDFLEADSLRQQLVWIAQSRAKVHLEISGGAEPGALIQPFLQNVKGLVHSVGINDGELLEITDLRDLNPPLSITGGASGVYQRYERALRLAQELSLDRIYVHGNDVDLILRKGGSPGDMRAEIQADLFAKGIVVLAVLQRSVGDWRGYLKADGTIAVARNMLYKALSACQNVNVLNQAEQLLKEAEEAFSTERFDEAEKKANDAQVILQQNGIPKEPGQAALSLSPILLAKSFETLIEFAYDYVFYALHKGDPSSPSGLTKEGEELFQRITETGYYAAHDPQGYSVAIVPVMWPELPIELNPTGAGDICSGISLVYSGF